MLLSLSLRVATLYFVCEALFVFCVAVSSNSRRNTQVRPRNDRKLYNYQYNNDANNYNNEYGGTYGGDNYNEAYGASYYNGGYVNNYANYNPNDYNNNENYQNQNYDNSNYIWQRDDDDNYKNDDNSYYNSNSQYSAGSFYNGRGESWGGQSVQSYNDDEEPEIVEEGFDEEEDEQWNVFGKIDGLTAKETVAITALVVVVTVSLVFLLLLAIGCNIIDFIGIYCCCGLFGHADQGSSPESLEDGFVKLGDY